MERTLKYNIPKHVRALQRSLNINHKKYIPIFKSGGLDPEPEFLKKDKRLKKTFQYVSSTGTEPTEDGKAKYGFKQSSGNWIYCGDGFFMRKLNGKYELSRFMAYCTDKSLSGDEKYIEPWDDEKYSS